MVISTQAGYWNPIFAWQLTKNLQKSGYKIQARWMGIGWES